jgi:two-component system sensor histidine kinase VanS
VADAPPPVPARRRPAGLSVRAQLTLSYAAFVVIVGVAFFFVGFLLLRFVPDGNLLTGTGGFVPTRSDLLDVFVKYAVLALVLLAIIGLGGGWLLAGRMLGPLGRITATARLARDGRLDQRIRMPGRQNELAELADAFDDMLDRVQLSVEEHRRFAANASHELRTPHAVIRTMLEVARADPEGRDVDVLLGRIDQMNERSIVLTEALLTLADADHDTARLTTLDLVPVTSAVIDENTETADQAGVRISTQLAPGIVRGDETLLRQLISNLVQNAIVHNRADGTVQVSTARAPHGGMVLEVTNTGAPLDEEALATFTEPFTRGAGRTRRRGERHVGSGLGLAIVASVARVHGATLDLTPRDGGGLRARVTFPAAGVAAGRLE